MAANVRDRLMAQTATVSATVHDGGSLRQQLAHAERDGHFRALGLIAPLLLFLLLSFAVPITMMLSRSVYDPSIANNLPRTLAALQGWDGKAIPDEPVFAALVADLKEAQANNLGPQIGKRMNYEISGIRSEIISSTSAAADLTAPPYKDQMLAASDIWNDTTTWAKIKQAGPAITPFYLLSAFDLQRDDAGSVVAVDPDRAVYVEILARTFLISLTVTVLTLLLGYPVAYMLANSPVWLANILMLLVLIPFWTSLLVRTTAWYVLLQDNGPINNLAHLIGFSAPLKLIFSRAGTIIAMTHIQLPFTLLPIYSVMKGISPSYMRAARSLGGGPVYSFARVYFPLTLPGIGAGCLLTFILSLGYYITPALVGGAADQMVSGIIADALNSENNWGKACALGTVLLAATLVMFYIYNRVVGIDKVKLG